MPIAPVSHQNDILEAPIRKDELRENVLGPPGVKADSLHLPELPRGNVLSIIQEEHRKVEGLFRALRVRRPERAALVKELAREVVAHNEAEERTFYKFLGEHDPTDEEKMKVEHVGGALHLLHLMEENDVLSTAWELKLTKLCLALTHHVDDEETVMHNKAREVFSEEQLEQFGRAFKEEKQRLLSENVGTLEHVKEIASTATMVEKAKDLICETKSKLFGQ
jgi:hemerythrin superfamily protein